MRSALNSQSLFEKNKRLYRDFFANYPLVVSSPGGAILAGAFSHQFGGVGLHQKIPLRNYMGVKITDKPGITYKHLGTYDIFADCFITLNDLPELNDKFKYLKERLKRSGFKQGLEIGILNELPRRCGLNNPGVQSANLATIYMLVTGIIDEKDLKSFIKGDNKIDNQKQKRIKKIVKEFHSIWIGPNNSGFGAISCFVKSFSPVVFQANRIIKATSLSNLFNFPDKNEFPYDVVIIGTSDRKDIDFSLRKYDEISVPLKINKREINSFERRGFVVPQKSKKDINDFILNKYRESINASALNCTFLLGKMIDEPDFEKLDSCFTAFNDAFSTICLVSNEFKRKNKVANYLQSFFYEKCPDLKYALATSIANNIVILFPREHFRGKLPELKKYLEEKIDFEITYPYISWIDNFEEEAERIEQWRKKKIYSDILPKDSLVIKIMEKTSDKVVTKSISSKERLIKILDICFDLDENKVFCRGEKMNSKDLPSSSATIELFNAIIKNQGSCVKNKKLSHLSYFNDRNELQSKIISPLKNLCLKKCNSILNLKIHGSYTSFDICYYPSNLKIGLIKRI